MIWEIIKDKTEDHWLELKGSSGGKKEVAGKWVPIWDVHVVCKWDGCVDYETYANGYEYNHECDEDCERGVGCCRDYIHFCDIDDFIKGLIDMKKIAIDFFGDGEWN